MNPENARQAWLRLSRGARQARDDRDVAAPYGFSTRVVALAFSAERRGSVFDRIALRAVGVACLLALASVAVNYVSLSSPAEHQSAPAQEQVNADDPMSVLLDV